MGSFDYPKTTKYRRRKRGKVNTLLNKKLESVEWGEYKLGDLFEVTRGLSMYVKDKESFVYVSKNNTNAIPLVQQMNHSNGISAYIDKSKLPNKFKNKIEKAGKISINPDQPLSYYQETEFIGNSVIIIDTSKLTKKQALYVATEIQRIRKGSTWNDKFPKEQVKIAKIQLPTKNGKIDFEFMENFMTELEADYIMKLEAYLSVTGLKDYTLTEEEKQVLEDFENIEWGKFRLGVLFEKITTKKLPFKAEELPKQITGKYTLPCLTSSFRNQGLNYFVPKDEATILKNVISIPSNSDIYRSYFQSNEFTILSDAYAIRWIFDSVKLLPNQYLFTVQCINKVTDLSIYSYKNKLGGWNVVKNKYIQLPIKNGKLDYKLMETLISAIKKMTIKDVVLYADKKLE